MLDRCGADGTCPLIFETFGGSELWALRISSNLATLDLAKDIALPPNVRRYYLPGTAHGGGPAASRCRRRRASARCRSTPIRRAIRSAR
jgi:hypothetical protein